MAIAMEKLRNVCLLGHGGDGKTSLVESILFANKVIDRLGKVTDGTTVSDYDAEEIKRTISIQTTLERVEIDAHKINLLDAPGFFDFVGESVEAQRVGDAALIVIGAKSGLAVGSQKVWRNMRDRNKACALYISKMDEEHADFFKTLEAAKEAFGNSITPFVIPIMEKNSASGIVNIITGKAYTTVNHVTKEIPVPEDMKDLVAEYRSALEENVAETDDALMEKFFGGEPFTDEEFADGIRKGMISRRICPVFCGSAFTGLGTDELVKSILAYFPSPVDTLDETDISSGEEKPFPLNPNGPACAFVFKTVADQYGRFSFFKVLSGKITSDMQLTNTKNGAVEKIGRIYMVRGKKNIEVSELGTGDIGAVAKLADTRTGDTLCGNGLNAVIKGFKFPRVCYTQAIVTKNKAAEEKMAVALARLHDEDPVFVNQLNPETHQQTLSGLGDIHLDVLCSKMRTKFGVEIGLEPPRVAYREKIRKTVEAQGRHKKQSGGHGQFGDVKIRFEPCDSLELVFAEEVFGGSVPKNFFPAVEKGLRESMEKGVLAGYPVVNLKAVLFDGSYHDVDSNELSFKLAARLAYKNGLPQASPVIMEPIGLLKVRVPAEYMGDVSGDLSKRRGRVMGMEPDGDNMQVIEAEVPMSEMHSYAIDLRSMTRGWGNFTLDFVRYEDAPPMVQQQIIEEAKTRMTEDDDE